MRRFLSAILFLVILVMPLISFAEKRVISDDQCVSEVFFKYAGSLGKVSYKEVKEHLDSLGYNYKTNIGHNDFASFDIDCEYGSLYICFYPLGHDDSEFGNPEKEMLTLMRYERDGKSIIYGDSYHLNGGWLSKGDESHNPATEDAFSLDELVNYYNDKIGGHVSLEPGTKVTTDYERKAQIKHTVRTRSEEYYDTTIQRIEVNSNIGTDDPDDYLILIYFRWDAMNGVDRTQRMLEMFSDDMAATLASKHENIDQIVIFWEVPYLLKTGTCAKYTYNVWNSNAYRAGKSGPLYINR